MDPSYTEKLAPLDMPEHSCTTNTEGGNEKPIVQRNVALGLTRNYAADWTVQDALRELYQNWKDAILQHYQMSLLDFTPYISSTPDHITIVVGRQPLPVGGEGRLPQQALGYIRFNKIQGSAEFTNFGSTLEERCLEMGHTTKAKDERLAGGHGEGLKIAALVLCRANHHVKISTGGFHWNFGFNGQSKTNFFCRLTPTRAKRDLGAYHYRRGANPVKLHANIWDDVSVTVEKGHKGRPVSNDDFRSWMHDTVDLHPPSGRIRTPSGDLLLAPMYQGHLYLKGMRVPEPTLSNSAFRLGYNLIRGSVDRDRQRLVNTQQVIEGIHAIWECAIAQAETAVLPRYLHLLRGFPLSSDVRGADLLVSEAIATKLWAALRREAMTGGGVFYCPESSQHQDAPIIRSELRQEPRVLSDLLWNILRQYHFVRDPMEELYSRFKDSEKIELPDTDFAHGVARTLRALMALEPVTHRTKVVFVRCETRAIDVAYRSGEDILYVHEKWLHPFDSDRDDGAIHSAEQPDLFICQRVVEELYRRTITIIVRTPHNKIQSSQALYRLSHVSYQKLHQMPRMVHLSPAEDGTAVSVSFYTGHSLAFVELYGSRVHYLVVLHRARCSRVTEDVVYNARDDVCDCPRRRVTLTSRTAHFSTTDEGPWIPMVVKMPDDSGSVGDLEPPLVQGAEDGALIGILSRAVIPLQQNITCATATDSSLTREGDVFPQLTMAGQIAGSTVTQQPLAAAVSVDVVGNQASEDVTREGKNGWPTPEHLEVTVQNFQEPGYKCVSGVDDTNHSTSEFSELASATPEPTPWKVEPTTGNIEVAAPSGEALESDAVDCGRQSIKHNTSNTASTTPLSGRNGESYLGSLENLKGKYVQATLKASNTAGNKAGRHVLFIHKIMAPASGGSSPQLIATRYSFLADHPALVTEKPIARDRELLLHFQDADHMAQEDDAEIINLFDDIVTVDTIDVQWTVTHISQCPDPATGFFARYSIRDGHWLRSLFVTTLNPALCAADNQLPPPRFSSLPVASVFDLSPHDLSLSAGFAQVGYRIRAAIGFDEGWSRHQLWKSSYPGAVIYPGSPASVIADLDGQGLTLLDTGENRAPRIVTISGTGPSPDYVHMHWCDRSSTEQLTDILAPLQHCSLVAQSPTLTPDFIVLTLPHSILRSQFRNLVATTIRSLLGQGYSVTLKPLSLGRSDEEDGQSVLLLATPCGTKPEWIDDTFADLQVSPAAIGSRNDSMVPFSTQTDNCWSGSTSLEEVDFDQVIPAMNIPTSSHVDLLTEVKVTDSSDTLEGLPDAGHLGHSTAHLAAAAISRIIGEFSKRNYPVASLAADHPAVDHSEASDRTKRMRVESLT
ncbi:hypothetical protein BDV41DRAFT_579005 [Aspergillus transmontanensis]|uniref:Uncharacterized protein n=1 Tax=Aspergillus transmontanensis TaxID=1034304 RepID=A0A5N6VR23_9EURO|nr:hypothetical protein BDV41DRAFT_579005 [Aspergillus transmontanensis]